MSKKVIVSAGTRYGLLSVLHEVPERITTAGLKRRQFLCKCDCGSEKIVGLVLLRGGRTRSCGCKHIEWTRRTRHGLCAHPLYNVWHDMLRRCENERHKDYFNYGGRGITVCDEWRGDDGLKRFVEWSTSNGYRSGLEIDRADNNSGYGPSNCRWVSHIKNTNNIRRNVVVLYDGQSMSFSEFFRTYGANVSYSAALARYRRGIPLERVLWR